MRHRIVALASFLAMILTVIAVTATAVVPVSARVDASPSLVSPPDNFQMSDFGFTLQWRLPSVSAGVTQYHLQIRPNSLDGPEINVIRNRDESFVVPPPPNWYVILPDMTYVWRVRATDKVTFAPADDPEWGPWSPSRYFKSPKVSSEGILAVSPAQGAPLQSRRAVILQWAHPNTGVFYYEVQMSGDPAFNADPATATSFVWNNLIHGGTTNPANSWETPPLTPGVNYYWRVRPRVQGDGTPLPWSRVFCINPGCEKIFIADDPVTAPAPPATPTPTPAPAPPVASPTPNADGTLVEIYTGKGTAVSTDLHLTPGIYRYVMISFSEEFMCASLAERTLGHIDDLGCLIGKQYIKRHDVIIRQEGGYRITVVAAATQSYIISVYQR